MGYPAQLNGLESVPIALVNATVVLEDREVSDGSVVIRDGLIETICPSVLPDQAHVVDLDGNFLMPGLIDLHSDAIEHEVQPRPKTFLPFDLAVRQADRLFATVGITTAYHSLSFLSDKESHRGNGFNTEFSRAIAKLSGSAIIENRIHARYEITNAEGLECILSLVEDGTVTLLSIMDHTPGQGQYPDEAVFREYYRSTGMTDEAIDSAISEKKLASQMARPAIEALSASAKKYGIPFASHDDDLPSRFPDHQALGINISEFPMNVPSAQTAREYGFTVLVGSPNVLRGQSTGTGPRAIELIEAGYADALCSDYMPATVLPAIFKIVDDLGWPFWKAVRLGTANPARGAKLSDRGRIATGLRADLIEVEHHFGWPVVRKLWSAGRLTYASTPIEGR